MFWVGTYKSDSRGPLTYFISGLCSGGVGVSIWVLMFEDDADINEGQHFGVKKCRSKENKQQANHIILEHGSFASRLF